MKEFRVAKCLVNGLISEDDNMITAKIYEEQCEQEFVHQEQPNEDYFEGLNDYFDGTMSI